MSLKVKTIFGTAHLKQTDLWAVPKVILIWEFYWFLKVTKGHRDELYKLTYNIVSKSSEAVIIKVFGVSNLSPRIQDICYLT